MHVLVVGGTGMLAQVTEHLCTSGNLVSVVARHPERVVGVNPLAVDYHDHERLAVAVRGAIAQFGPVELAVCWVHGTAPTALPLIAHELALPTLPFRLVHIRGSGAADPTGPGLILPDWVPRLCAYQQVVLGWRLTGGRSHWLSHGEISGGVIHALATKEPVHIVGRVRPWAERPGW